LQDETKIKSGRAIGGLDPATAEAE